MKRLSAIFFALCLAGCGPACGSGRAQSFNLQTGRETVTSLDGLWRFHTGDNLRWADPSFDDSQWPLLRSDRSWTEQGYPDYGGYAWYRFKIQVPDGSHPPGLLLREIITGYQLYANGKLVDNVSTSAPTRNPVLGAARANILKLPIGSEGPQTIQIALRVWNYAPFASWLGGGSVSPGNAAGDPALLTIRLRQYRNTRALRYTNTYTYALLATLVGLTTLALFFFRCEDREYLWFSVLLLAGAADAALNIVLNLGSLPFPLCRLLGEIAGGLSEVAAMLFFSIILRTRRSVFWWTACLAAAVSPLTVALFYFQWTGVGISYAILLLCLLPGCAWIVVVLAVRALRKDASARLLLAPAAFLYALNAIDLIDRIIWQLGWQKSLGPLHAPLLRYPFPLYLTEIVNYVFILALLIFLVRRFSLARQEETRLSTEMEAARSVQSLLVPATAPLTPGFHVESVYLPASEVGGDFFHVEPGGDGSLLVVIGDVSGKGLKAAMTVSTLVGALRGCSLRRPAEVLAYLNRVLHGHIGGFVTCTAALIAADGTMTLANAGGLAPYLNGQELAVESGLPLGVIAEASYAETHHRIDPQARLTFVSDGVVEATNGRHELFGFERTQTLSNRSAHTIAEGAQNFGQQDDISVLSITRTQNPKAAIA